MHTIRIILVFLNWEWVYSTYVVITLGSVMHYTYVLLSLNLSVGCIP